MPPRPEGMCFTGSKHLDPSPAIQALRWLGSDLHPRLGQDSLPCPRPRNRSRASAGQNVLCGVTILSPKLKAEICFSISVISHDGLTGREIYTALRQGTCQAYRSSGKWQAGSTEEEHKCVPWVTYAVLPHLVHVCQEQALELRHRSVLTLEGQQ